jgi:hypothetical protein
LALKKTEYSLVGDSTQFTPNLEQCLLYTVN